MNRLTVLQKIIDHIKARTYLEIGVEKGTIISRIKAPHKIGVDPKMIFPKRLRIQKLLGFAKFQTIEETSDIFFEKYATKILFQRIDVAFIDGLHTYQQSLKDVENTLRYLNTEGIIVLHDCNPLNYASAYPVKKSIDEVIRLADQGDLPGWNGAWNGDVWKALAHLRIKHENLNIFTLDLDWGLGIISFGKSTPLKQFTIEEIQNADYAFLEKNRTTLLNLQPPKYLDVFLGNRP